MLAACGMARNNSSAGFCAGGCALMNAVAPIMALTANTMVVRMAGILAPSARRRQRLRRHGPRSRRAHGTAVPAVYATKGCTMESRTLAGDELEERFLQLQADTRGEFSAVRHEVHRLAETLRVEIRAGDAETRRYMRVLHEEVLSRIAGI